MHVHCVGGPIQTHLSGLLVRLYLCTRLILRTHSLYCKRHVNNFVSVLILLKS